MIRKAAGPIVRNENGEFVPASGSAVDLEQAKNNTLAAQILNAHTIARSGEMLTLRFDVLASPDDNYASVLQEFRAIGRDRFALPWVFTNCHNSLGCTGGTVSNDDHRFGLDCVKKYGGIYVPPYCAVIHQYMREAVVRGGQLVLASDSHTRYGALGVMGIGEGGTELARQAVGDHYTIRRPEIVAVRLTGKLRSGAGPMDAALALIGDTFANGFCKNKILEFSGPGVEALDLESRFVPDAMTTEAGAFSTIWTTDDQVQEWFASHGRAEHYKQMFLTGSACYDGLIEMDLSLAEPMIALPFHPSNVFTLRALNGNRGYLEDVLAGVEAEALRRTGRQALTLRDKIRGGRLTVQSATIGGCVGGTRSNLAAAAELLKGFVIPADGVPLGLYPASCAVMEQLEESGHAALLRKTGAVFHPSICGPCFGVLDIPADNSLSVRAVARNYFGREGSRPDQGQLSASALMDARSIAATVRNGGRLTSAEEYAFAEPENRTGFNAVFYRKAVYNGWEKPIPDHILRFGPNIRDWPALPSMGEHLLLKVTGKYTGSITTDELCPSGEASALRSNPQRLATYTLISRDRDYVERATAFRDGAKDDPEIRAMLARCAEALGLDPGAIQTGNLLVSDAIGDGSSREQATSNQKILGGWANLATEYSTKRYRSNCISWGLIPLRADPKDEETFATLSKLNLGDYLLLPNVRSAILSGAETLAAYLPKENKTVSIPIDVMTPEERSIITAGSVINYYRG